MYNLARSCIGLAGKTKTPLNRFAIVPCRKASKLNDKEQVVKRFKPALDTSSAEVVTETIERPSVNMQEMIKEQQVKRRKLNWLDKKILVRLGKYKSVEEVPDEIMYKNVKATEEAKSEVRGYITEKGFRGIMMTDYLLTLICAALLGATYYIYSIARPSERETKPKD